MGTGSLLDVSSPAFVDYVRERNVLPRKAKSKPNLFQIGQAKS